MSGCYRLQLRWPRGEDRLFRKISFSLCMGHCWQVPKEKFHSLDMLAFTRVSLINKPGFRAFHSSRRLATLQPHEAGFVFEYA